MRGLVGVDGRLERVDLGLLLVDRLLRAGALADQVLETGEVLLRRRRAAPHPAPSWPWPDRARPGRGADRRWRARRPPCTAWPSTKFTRLQLAVDLAVDGDRVRGLHRAEPVEIDRHVVRGHIGDRHRHGRRLFLLRRARGLVDWCHRFLNRRAIHDQQDGRAERDESGQPRGRDPLALPRRRLLDRSRDLIRPLNERLRRLPVERGSSLASLHVTLHQNCIPATPPHAM